MMPKQIPKKAHWFIFQNDSLLIPKNKDKKFLTSLLLSSLESHFVRQFYLGEYNRIHCYGAELPPHLLLPEKIRSIAFKKSFDHFGLTWYDALVKAYSIIHWDKNHQFCSRCGTSTVHTPETFERVCPSCHLFFYPRISPSIIVLIKKNQQVLMARSPHFPPGIYALVAGFVEAGESVEQAVHREVKEEVNIEIKNLQYFGSQPWPFPDSLMMGFIADYASGEITINRNEIEDAGWYRFDHLPGWPSASFSIAKKLIDYFVAEETRQSKKS